MIHSYSPDCRLLLIDGHSFSFLFDHGLTLQVDGWFESGGFLVYFSLLHGPFLDLPFPNWFPSIHPSIVLLLAPQFFSKLFPQLHLPFFPYPLNFFFFLTLLHFFLINFLFQFLLLLINNFLISTLNRLIIMQHLLRTRINQWLHCIFLHLYCLFLFPPQIQLRLFFVEKSLLPFEKITSNRYLLLWLVFTQCKIKLFRKRSITQDIWLVIRMIQVNFPMMPSRIFNYCWVIEFLRMTKLGSL